MSQLHLTDKRQKFHFIGQLDSLSRTRRDHFLASRTEQFVNTSLEVTPIQNQSLKLVFGLGLSPSLSPPQTIIQKAQYLASRYKAVLHLTLCMVANNSEITDLGLGMELGDLTRQHVANARVKPDQVTPGELRLSHGSSLSLSVTIARIASALSEICLLILRSTRWWSSLDHFVFVRYDQLESFCQVSLDLDHFNFFTVSFVNLLKS